MTALNMENIWLWRITTVVVALVTFTLLAYVFWFSYAVRLPVAITTSEWGQFGDYIGGVVGTVLGGATVALLVLSILIQMETYNTTKAELAATSKALDEQLKQARDQATLDNFQSTMEILLGRLDGMGALRKLGELFIHKFTRGDFTKFEDCVAFLDDQFRSQRASLAPVLKLVARLGVIAAELEADTQRTKLLKALGACLDDKEIAGLRILGSFEVPTDELTALVGTSEAFQMSRDDESIVAGITSELGKRRVVQ